MSKTTATPDACGNLSAGGETSGEMLVRVYEYGCAREAIRGMDAAIDQILRRNELWNRIVEIDNEIRTKMDAVLHAGPQEDHLAGLRQGLTELRTRLAQVRADAKSSLIDSAQLVAQIRTAVVEIQTILAEVKQIRKANARENRPLLRELNSERLRRIQEAQVSAGLYWCNRTAVVRNYEVARARAMKEGRRLKGRLCNGAGSVCVYFQRGLQVAAVFGDNGRLQIDPVPEEAWNSPSRSTRRRLARTNVRMRVAVNAGGPVWLELPMTMHRPLPEGAVIRWATIVREQIGLAWRHRLLLTVRTPACQNARSADAVGVDLGWRITPEGLRVAYWCGTDGRHGTLVLRRADLLAFKQIGALQSAIKAAHEQAKSFLRSYLDRQALPAPLMERASAALSSPSPRLLVTLLQEWRASRFSGDRYGFGRISAWQKQHIHLWTWQANLRDQLIRKRRELYRCFAAELASRYGIAFVNDVPLRRIVKRSLVVCENIPAQRQNRFVAAVSVLVRILQNAFEKNSGTLTRIQSAGAMMACYSCGTLDQWNPAETLTHTCSHCCTTWDQDFNASLNLLRRGLAARDDTC